MENKNKWFLEYEKDVLYSTINRSRMDRGRYDFIKEVAINRIIKTNAKKGETELDTVKRLIKEIRDGRKL